MNPPPLFSTPLPQNDRLLSLISMIVGATFLTISAFYFNEHDESRTNAIVIGALSGLSFLTGIVLLLFTHRRSGLPVWNLLLAGNVCGGGAFGFATLILGTEQVFQSLACSTWAWVFGMALFTWTKGCQKHDIGNSHQTILSDAQPA